MKRVWLLVGYQRMAGEVRKLDKPWAVVGRRNDVPTATREPIKKDSDPVVEVADELEIREIVRWKIIINTRPEPIGSSST